jgi:hypothetical protein
MPARRTNKRAKRRPEYEIRMAPWLRALGRDDETLFWAVFDCLRSLDDVTDRDLRRQRFAKAHEEATKLLDAVEAGTARGVRVADRLDVLSLRLDCNKAPEILERCPTCGTRVAPEQIKRPAARTG